VLKFHDDWRSGMPLNKAQSYCAGLFLFALLHLDSFSYLDYDFQFNYGLLVKNPNARWILLVSLVLIKNPFL
jgi:hypothetical protein